MIRTETIVRYRLCHFSVLLDCSANSRHNTALPDGTPFRKAPLVKVQADRVHLIDGAIKASFEVPMRTKRFSDMSCPSLLCSHLDRLEVVDIGLIEEHISDRSCLFVNLVRVAGQDDPLCDDAGRVHP